MKTNFDVNAPLKMLKNKKNIRTEIADVEKSIKRTPFRAESAGEMFDNTGLLLVDTLITQSADTIVTDPTSTDFTGTFMDGNGQTFNSVAYNIGGVRNGVLQWGARQDDGVITAGDGSVELNNDGIVIYSSSDNLDSERIQFLDRNTLFAVPHFYVSAWKPVDGIMLAQIATNAVYNDESMSIGLLGRVSVHDDPNTYIYFNRDIVAGDNSINIVADDTHIRRLQIGTTDLWSGNLGTLAWSTTFDTLELTQTGTTLQLGQEAHFYIKNESGVEIGDGKAVMFAGAVGASGVLKGTAAINDGTNPPSYYMGIATQAIAHNGFGKVTFFGLVQNLTTTDFTDGDLLYVNPATTDGSLTNVAPTGANQWLFPVAACVLSNTGNGSIFSRAIPVQPNHATTVFTTASTDSLTPVNGNYQTYTITALAEALTINNPTSAIDGQKMVIRIKDNGTSRTITWGTNFRAVGTTIPTATTVSKWVYIGCIYNVGDTKWDIVAVSTEA